MKTNGAEAPADRAISGRRLGASRPVLAALVLAIASGSALSDAPASARKVVIEAMRFTPQTLTVRQGETVTWENRDPFPHTVTSWDADCIDKHSLRSFSV